MYDRDEHFVERGRIFFPRVSLYEIDLPAPTQLHRSYLERTLLARQSERRTTVRIGSLPRLLASSR